MKYWKHSFYRVKWAFWIVAFVRLAASALPPKFHLWKVVGELFRHSSMLDQALSLKQIDAFSLTNFVT